MTNHALTSGVLLEWDFYNWLSQGRDLGQLRYSKLRKISTDIIGFKLRFSWAVNISWKSWLWDMLHKFKPENWKFYLIDKISLSKTWQGRRNLRVLSTFSLTQTALKNLRFKHLYTRNSELTISCLSCNRVEPLMNIFPNQYLKAFFAL